MYIEMGIPGQSRRVTRRADMASSRSVAEARSELPRLIREVEHGRAVEITRRGRPVAVLVSVDEHRRLVGGHESFDEVYGAWLQSVDRRAAGVPASYFAKLRDRSPGRDFAL
jgi:prevent-host-death family protein